MKNKILYGLGVLLVSASSLSLTSCIQETEPTNSITETQIQSSQKSLESLLWGMPSVLNREGIFGSSYGFDWGYGAIMHIRDRETADCTRPYAGGYDWFNRYEYNLNQGENSLFTQFMWNSYYKFIQSANEMIKAVPDESAVSDEVKGYKGAGYAFRAMLYLDLARAYEYLPTDVTDHINADGNDVLNLTVPIVDENTTQESAANNPRVSRKKMAEFILGDLQKAEKLIPNLTQTSKTLPHLDCVYGLYARLYMWLAGEDNTYYAKAKEYADKAIEASDVAPMTESECLSTSTGFNDISKWMWGDQLVKENDAVQTGIINWTSWMSNETSFGYASAGPYLTMDAKMYDRIDNNDFRKNMWAPGAYSQSTASWYQDYCIDLTQNDYIGYSNWGKGVSIKFRPGYANMGDVNIGASTAYPLMRIEEMYFISIEAEAHINANQGKEELVQFMQENRNPEYTCDATSQDDIIEEIVFQKRVELWGEGQTFFDIKRLNYSVDRTYRGTNHPASAQLSTNGRPAWMNWVIVLTEQNNNKALVGWNNPDPTGKY